VHHRLGTAGVEIHSVVGVLLVSHGRETPRRGHVVREPVHKAALEHVVLAAFTVDPPCRRKTNWPPGGGGRADAAKLLSDFEDDEVVVSLAAYSAHGDPPGQMQGNERGLGRSSPAGIARLPALERSGRGPAG
jgi:hypothetical protein